MTPPPMVAGREESIDALYGALLHRAHVEGLYGVQVALLQAPTDENGRTALVRAEVHTVQGVFSAIGEADGDSCNTSGLCGSAELRAKVRALQDALDAPAVALCPPLAEQPVEGRPSLWAIVRDERIASGAAGLLPARPRLDVLPGGLR